MFSNYTTLLTEINEAQTELSTLAFKRLQDGKDSTAEIELGQELMSIANKIFDYPKRVYERIKIEDD